MTDQTPMYLRHHKKAKQTDQPSTAGRGTRNRLTPARTANGTALTRQEQEARADTARPTMTEIANTIGDTARPVEPHDWKADALRWNAEYVALLAQNEALRAWLERHQDHPLFFLGPDDGDSAVGLSGHGPEIVCEQDDDHFDPTALYALAQSSDISALDRLRDYDKDDALLLARANIKALHSEADELLALITELAAYGASVPEYDPSLTLVPKALTDRARSLLRTNSDTSDGE